MMAVTMRFRREFSLLAAVGVLTAASFEISVDSATTAATVAIGGKITEFAGPTGGVLRSIAPGPDGNVWFVEDSRDKIGRITPNGQVMEYAIPMPPRSSSAQPFGIAPGPDGNLWFTEGARGRIGRIAPSGAIAEFFLPDGNSQPTGIAAGPDRALWFTENFA